MADSKHTDKQHQPSPTEQVLEALNLMQSLGIMMPDGRHPRDVLRSFIQLSQPAPFGDMNGMSVLADRLRETARLSYQTKHDRDLMRDAAGAIEAAAASATAPSFKEQDADMLAAAVDAAIRRGALDPRSEIADCRLDYGQPFTAEEGERHLSKRRHGKNAAYVAPEAREPKNG